MRHGNARRLSLAAALLAAGVLGLAHSAAAVDWTVEVVEGVEPGTDGYVVEIYVNGSLAFTEFNSMTPGSPGTTVDYLVTMNVGDLVEAQLSSQGSADYDLFLYDEAPVLIDSSTFVPGGIPDEPDFVTGVRDDPYEDNDTRAAATDFTAGEAQWLSVFGGDYGCELDDDWYQITVAAGFPYVTVDCRFTDSLGDIDIELCDSTGAMLASGSSISDNELINGYDVGTPGTYYVLVYGFPAGGTGNTYDLLWSTSSTAPPPSLLPPGCSPGAGGTGLAWLLPLAMAAMVLRRKVGLHAG